MYSIVNKNREQRNNVSSPVRASSGAFADEEEDGDTEAKYVVFPQKEEIVGEQGVKVLVSG